MFTENQNNTYSEDPWLEILNKPIGNKFRWQHYKYMDYLIYQAFYKSDAIHPRRQNKIE